MNYGRFGAVGDLAPQLAGMFGRLLGCGKRCTPALFNVSEGLDVCCILLGVARCPHLFEEATNYLSRGIWMPRQF